MIGAQIAQPLLATGDPDDVRSVGSEVEREPAAQSGRCTGDNGNVVAIVHLVIVGQTAS